MINRVLVAGRLLEAPRAATTPSGTPICHMRLEVRHPRVVDPVPDVCTLEVHAFGERRIDALTRYLKAGRDVTVVGRLCEHDGTVGIRADQVDFMMNDIQPRYFWVEAQRERLGVPAQDAA